MNRIVTLLIIISMCLSAATAQNIERLFGSPPDSTKVYVWWHWMKGNVSKEGITKDLEAMKQQGIGGATVFSIGSAVTDASCLMPEGPVTFFSNEWFDMFRHAVSEAHRLGVELGAASCEGWTQSGGPWIDAGHAMKMTAWTKTFVTAKTHFSGQLEKPQSKDNFYRDVYVIAYPRKVKVNTFHKEIKFVHTSSEKQAGALTDGNPRTCMEMHKPGRTDTSVIDFEFSSPHRAPRLYAVFQRQMNEWTTTQGMYLVVLESSQDGKTFAPVTQFYMTDRYHPLSFSFTPESAQFYRVRFISGEEQPSILISEVELLDEGERALYEPRIANLETLSGSQSWCTPDEYSKVNTDVPLAEVIQPAEIIDLTGKLTGDGHLEWDVPPGEWTVLRFGYTINGKKNHPASKNGEGYECDKMSREAVSIHFDHYVKRLIDAAQPYAGSTFRHILIDSWETEYLNWTQNFPDEFRNRRGYDLKMFLPVFAGDIVTDDRKSYSFLYDFRKTGSDLVAENYYSFITGLCHQYGIRVQSEGIYGERVHPPADNLATYMNVDYPMCEFWSGWKTEFHRNLVKNSPTEMVASAAHIFGKAVVNCESFTGQASWADHPWEIKDQTDQAFCRGINRLVIHSYVHQPDERKPGYTLGFFGIPFNRHNTWWNEAGGWIGYCNRIQAVLQNSRFAADVLYFAGDNIPNTEQQRIQTRIPNGYRTDVCNSYTLKNLMTVGTNKIVLNSGASYHLLVLPESKTMSASTLRKLAQLIRSGAIVAGPKPVYCLSLDDDKVNSPEQFKNLSDEVWGNCDGIKIKEHRFGTGKVYWGKSLAAILDDIGVKPDFKWRDNEDGNLIFLHQVADDREIYFVANQEAKDVNADCIFRIAGCVPELWDAETGSISKCYVYSEREGTTRIPIHFDPRGSVMVVFKKSAPVNHFTELYRDNIRIFPMPDSVTIKPTDEFELHGYGISYQYPEFRKDSTTLLFLHAAPGIYRLIDNAGLSSELKIRKSDTLFFKKPWNVRFDGISDVKQYSVPASWTISGDVDVKYFAGSAVYSNEICISKSIIRKDTRILLQADSICNFATIRINGNALPGLFWKPPYMADITNYVLPGVNQIEIRVTNNWINRLIGDLSLPPEKRATWTTALYDQWINKDTQLFPSGMIGVVKIVGEKNWIILE